jgi:5'-nucleotidase
VPDSDVTGLAERLITVTPLQFNMTRHDQLENMKNWTWTESPSAID